MKLVTDWVNPNEPAYGLFEGPCLVPNILGTSERWVQDIKVIRNDQVHHYVQDLGPAENFDRVQPLLMPSLGTDTVAQLQAFADKNREDDYWARYTDELMESSTLIQDHLNQWEQGREAAHNRTVIGPHFKKQRNSYPRQAVWRRYFDTRAERTGKRVFTSNG